MKRRLQAERTGRPAVLKPQRCSESPAVFAEIPELHAPEDDSQGSAGVWRLHW